MEVLDRSDWRKHNPMGASSEQASRRAKGGSRIGVMAEAVVVISAAVLAGGGAGMLGGIALGAINPFFLGMAGVVVGAVASVPLGRAILKRPEEGGTGPPASPVATHNPPDAPGDAQAAAVGPEAGGYCRTWWRRVFGG